MKDLLTKLAQVATDLDRKGHSEQAFKVDSVLQKLHAELQTLAETPYAGSAGMNPDEIANMQNKAPAALPPSVQGKVVIKSKIPDATGYGFFGIDQIEKAVKEGRVDMAEAINAMKAYLKLTGSPLESNTWEELKTDAIGSGRLPNRGPQAEEVYGHKGFWQRLLGK